MDKNTLISSLIRSTMMLVGSLMVCCALLAQGKIPKKAQKRYAESVNYYMAQDVHSAIRSIDDAIEVAPGYGEAWLLRAELLEDVSMLQEAAESIVTALKVQPGLSKKWREKGLRLLFQVGDYDEALNLLHEGSLNPDWRCKDSVLEASIRFAAHAIKNELEIDLSPLIGDVNSNFSEYYPALFLTGDRMIFTREIPGMGQSLDQEDFFEAQCDLNGDWHVTRALDEINTAGNEGAPAIRGDGRYLVFTACETLIGGYGKRSGKGSCDLFETRWLVNEGKYDIEENLTELNSNKWESQPSLSSDGRWIFFIRAERDRSGNLIQDIYQSEKLDDGSWSKPRRLPDHINSPGREENPVIHPDGKTLYFASDGHAGMGGMDLYVVKLDDNGVWSNPLNLGYPINTLADENSLQVFPDGRLALFASDRRRPGDLDLWKFVLPDHGSAEEVNIWQGRVYNAKNNKPIEAVVQILDLDGNHIGRQRSDGTDGAFTLSFPLEEAVILQVEQPGYLFYSQREESFDAKEMVIEVPLWPLEIGSILILTDVLFETSSSSLAPDFQPELEQLAKTMKQSDVKIRITGHTDGLGNTRDNLELSLSRARAVRDYLVEMGVDQSRLEVEGMGARRPLATNDTPEGRARNRRTEIEVIE
ncbi:MAG: OmpA family protein [Flavobacteriales bacterium]